jgi:intracellular sulfur oxidation DsrE/DsrF family protein
MNKYHSLVIRRFKIIVTALFVLVLIAIPALSGEYLALKGVKGVKTVFDVSQGSPQVANVVFWAIRNVHDDKRTRSLSEPPQVAVVFHGPAVKMISTDRNGFKDSDNEALNQFANTIQEMKNSGVRFEVCDYALKVMGVNPATVLPEIFHVDNGFISIAGYQAQGYSTITIN